MIRDETNFYQEVLSRQDFRSRFDATLAARAPT
jgi:hypothetical protein